MPAYTEITRPAQPAYTEIGKFFNLLLINTTDRLLINSSGYRLAISEGRHGLYSEIQKPSTSYSGITRPV